MKNRKQLFMGITLAFGTALAIATLNHAITQKRELRVGDYDEDGALILETNIDTSKLIKYKQFVTPTDTYYSKQKTYSLSNVGDIESTWEYYQGEDVLIAVIDSGFTYGHEDFIDEHGNSVFDDRSGYFYVDMNTETAKMKLATSDGWECMKHEYDDYYNEWDTHGSNVAGCAAASLNGVGTVGIAPKAKILACKIDFYDASINKAIEYAADCGADVINMSLGAYDLDDPHISSGDYQDSYDGVAEGNADSIAYAVNHGVIVVAAAGNESTNAKSYPACNDDVIGAGALAKNSNTSAASFSNFNKNTDTQLGNHNVDVMAPGVVWAPGLDESELGNSSSKYPKFGYSETQGTSFASPIVAGAAALWKSKYRTGTPAQFEADLYDSCVDMGNFAKYGNGRLDVYTLLDIEHEGIELSSNNFTLNTHSAPQTVTATSKNSTIKNWTSSNTSVVTVSGQTGVATATATITVVGPGTATITVTDNAYAYREINVKVEEYVAVTGITTTATSGTTLGQGKSLKLGASVLPANATNKTIVYESSDENIAIVSDTGVVTGVNIGNATITMTAEGPVVKNFAIEIVESHSETYEITFKTNSEDGSTALTSLINEIETGASLVNSSTATNIYKGKNGLKFSSGSKNGSGSLTFVEELDITEIVANASGYGSDSSSLSINGINKNLSGTSLSDYTYELDGTSIDTISFEANKRSYLRGLTITAGQDGTPVASVSLNKNALALETGQSETLTATILPNDATNKEVTWTSNNTSVATVSGGTVTAVGAGNATITVKTKSGGKTATCAVTVTDKVYPVTGVSLSPTSLSLDVGGSSSLTATISPSNATNKSVTWTSSASAVASVSNAGLVTGLKEGSATITVTTADGGFAATCEVSVHNVAVTGVSLNKTSETAYVGSSFSLTATVQPTNATNKGVSWTSSDTSVATVNSSGVVNPLVAGTTIITVTTTDGGFTASCTVTVQTGKSSLQKAYEACEDLSSGSYTSSAYTFTGYITAMVSNNFYVQDGAYGLYVYCGNTPRISSSDVGKFVTVVATLQNYYGLYETKSITSVTVGSDSIDVVPQEVTSYDMISNSKQSILSNLSSGIVSAKTQAGVSGSTDIKFSITVGGQTINVFGSKYLSNMSSLNSAYNSISVGDYISISNMATSYNNSQMQLALTETTVITKGYSLSAFCEEFLDNVLCDDQGRNAPTYATGYSWSTFKTLYGKLSSADQQTLRTTASSESGNSIERAVAKYDYIVAKYGYENFINRTVIPLSNHQKLIVNNSILFISIASLMVAISAAGVYFLLRKKKHQ